VTDTGDFRNRVSLTLPGTKAKLKINRQGSSKTLNVTIGQLEEQKLAQTSEPEQVDKLGISVQTITDDLARQFKTEAGKGVVISQVKPGSLAQRAGLDVGTVIFEVNREAISSADQFEKLIEQAADEGRALLLIGKENNTRFIVLDWEK
jgi:serine protease Do